MTENSIIFDLILMEADRVIAHRQKNFDLYYKDVHGAMVPIGDAYESEVETLINNIFKRKKMRYFITFTEAIELQDKLRPSAHKILRFFCRHMNYGNTLKNYGIRDIQISTSMSTNFVSKAIGELCENDILRFQVNKGRRTYMVNPIFFYKGTMKKLFYCVQKYDELPKRDSKLKEVKVVKDTIF
jgi:hypothetical protein